MAKRSSEVCRVVVFLRYLLVSPHIRADQGKTADNGEDSSRHMQCKYLKHAMFVVNELE